MALLCWEVLGVSNVVKGRRNPGAVSERGGAGTSGLTSGGMKRPMGRPRRAMAHGQEGSVVGEAQRMVVVMLGLACAARARRMAIVAMVMTAGLSESRGAERWMGSVAAEARVVQPAGRMGGRVSSWVEWGGAARVETVAVAQVFRRRIRSTARAECDPPTSGLCKSRRMVMMSAVS